MPNKYIMIDRYAFYFTGTNNRRKKDTDEGLRKKTRAETAGRKEATLILFLKKLKSTPTNPGLSKPSHLECTNMVGNLLKNILKIFHHQVP